MRTFAIAFIAAVSLCGCMTAPKPIAPGFDVTIVDAMTKQPISGASATVYADNNPDEADRETAGADGRVRVAPLGGRSLCLPHCHPAGGPVSVRFGAEGYSPLVIAMPFVEADYVRAGRAVELQHAPAP